VAWILATISVVEGLMIILGLDFETSGLPDKGEVAVAEVGLSLYDTDIKKIISSRGFLVDTGETVWQPGASAVNYLNAELCHEKGVASEIALNRILSHILQADVCVTHNGTRFDRPILDTWVEKHQASLPVRPWIDTYTDLPCRPQSLASLGGHHSFATLWPHSAEGDVHLMLRVLALYDFDTALKHATAPKLVLKALSEYSQKEIVRNQFFWAHYTAEVFTFWRKDILASDLEKEKAAALEQGYGLSIISGLTPVVSILGPEATLKASKGAVGK